MATAAAKENTAPKLDAPVQDDVKPLPSDKLKLIEYVSNRWRADFSNTPVRLEDYEISSVWNLVSPKLRAFDIIEAVNIGSWAEILVASAEPNFPIVVKVLRAVTFDSLPGNQHNDLPKDYSIRFNPINSTYAAFRNSDGTRMTPDLPTREACRTELVGHAVFRTR